MNGPADPRALTCDEVREMAGAFVLGALEPSDEAAVRSHLASCAEPHEEMDELGGVLSALADAVPVVEPPAALKNRIMAAAAADLAGRGAGGPVVATGTAAVPSPAPIAFPSEDERTARAARRGHTSMGAWILRIAAVVAIVALIGWNALLQGQLNEARSYEQSVAAVLDVAAQPGSLSAILVGDGGKGAGLAAVSPSGNVTMAIRDLAPTTGTAVYEAWVIGSNGVPVAIGGFTVGNAGTATLSAGGIPTVDGIVLALTLEPGPGATAPSGPIVSKGVASATG